ncbi:MAG: Ig-like domain-containing protein, partial [Bacteroidota bacterium]
MIDSLGSQIFHSPKTTRVLFTIRLALHCCILMLGGCAGQVPPDGGPIDRDPPQIISTYPANYTTQFHDNRIALEFDEYVDRRSVQESIFISPYVGELEFDWSGREVEVTFAEPLRENRTYVVTVGTDVVDVNNRNRMGQAVTLAFSTGDFIDQGTIEGQVYPLQSKDSPEGVMVFAYLLIPGSPDTLNPQTTKPDYITQSGKGGEFAFRHLLLGKYRLLAMRDEYRNLLYDPETDEYGVPASDIQLSFADTLRSDVFIRLAKEDTTAPRLIKITPQDRTHLLAEFSESLDTFTVAAQNFVVQDTTTGSSLAINAVASVLTKLSTVLVVTEQQRQEVGYKLTVERLTDVAGNEINPIANSLAFTGSGEPDTTRPNIASFSISDSARGVETS